MKKLAIIIITLMSVVGFSSDKSTTKFGEPIGDKSALKLDEILSNPQAHLTEMVVAEAKVNKVCKAKGCWMEVGGETHKARVTFKNYGFFVPQNILNKKVKIQGRLTEKTMSVKEQKHYLEDEGRPKNEIAAIKEPKTEYEFVADGVELIEK